MNSFLRMDTRIMHEELPNSQGLLNRICDLIKSEQLLFDDQCSFGKNRLSISANLGDEWKITLTLASPPVIWIEDLKADNSRVVNLEHLAVECLFVFAVAHGPLNDEKPDSFFCQSVERIRKNITSYRSEIQRRQDEWRRITRKFSDATSSQ